MILIIGVKINRASQNNMEMNMNSIKEVIAP